MHEGRSSISCYSRLCTWSHSNLLISCVLMNKAVFGVLAFMTVSRGSETVFKWAVLNVLNVNSTCWNLLLPSWLIGLTTTSSFFSWLVINLTFTRFREDNLMSLIEYWLFSGSGMLSQGIDPKSNSYYNRFQPWIAYWAMFWLSIFILISGYSVFFKWNTSKFVTSCRPFSSFPFFNQTNLFVPDLNLPIFFSLYLGYKYFNKTKFWKASEMDFYTVSDFSLSGFTSLTTLAS